MLEQQFKVGDIVSFTYHEKPRVLAIEKVATWGVQGACLPEMGDTSERAYSSYRWDRMETTPAKIGEVSP